MVIRLTLIDKIRPNLRYGNLHCVTSFSIPPHICLQRQPTAELRGARMLAEQLRDDGLVSFRR